LPMWAWLGGVMVVVSLGYGAGSLLADLFEE
jgi:hypothetical protein